MAHQKGTFTAVSPGEAPTEYHILFTVTAEDTGICYMVYTDNSLTGEGETRVFASIYEPDGEAGFLLPIENDWEWELLEDLLSRAQP